MEEILEKLVLETLINKSDSGNIYAQVSLGFLYWECIKVENNFNKAFEYFKQAAKHNSFALVNLAHFYENGIGVLKDNDKALEYYQLAAENGNITAQVRLARLYFHNITSSNIKEKMKESFRWWKKAADQGDCIAQVNVAYMLKKGWGVNKNTRQAREWYNKAVENAKKEGRHLLSINEYYKSGDSVFTYHGSNISSKDWYTYIKLDGDSETLLCFSFLYDRHYNIEPEYEDLFLWCRKLAENDNILAQTELGIMYLCAEGIQQNLEAAYKCFSIAAEKKDALASFLLSLMYKNGDVVKQDNSKAEELWQKSKFNLTVKEISYYSDIYYKNRNGVSPKFNKPKQEYPQINPKQEPSSVYDISKKEVTIIDKELTIKEKELNKDVFNMPNPVTIMGRSSSITNSFVNGIIPVIEPTEDEIHDALTILEQNEDDVRCVYCGDKKTEWDHLYPLIVNKKHTGYITEIANLVPACGKCNQSKGNSNWKEWMLSNAEKSPKTRGIKDLDRRIEIIENYDKYFQKRIINLEELAGKELWEKYQRAYDSIIFNMESAQKIMDEIKKRISVSPANVVSKISERPRKVFVVNKRPEVKNEEKIPLQHNQSSTVQTNNMNKESIDRVIQMPSQFWDGFQNYLVKRGYKLYTPSHLPSTVFEYRNAVSEIKEIEGFSLEDFCLNIDSIIRDYDVGGIKEELGRKKHNTWINALRRFREYLCFIL